jgi:hypothetical protein
MNVTGGSRGDNPDDRAEDRSHEAVSARDGSSACVARATVGVRHAGATLPPKRTRIPAANNNKVAAATEGEMLTKLLALTVVIGLLVAASTAFVASHPRALEACAAGCN